MLNSACELFFTDEHRGLVALQLSLMEHAAPQLLAEPFERLVMMLPFRDWVGNEDDVTRRAGMMLQPYSNATDSRGCGIHEWTAIERDTLTNFSAADRLMVTHRMEAARVRLATRVAIVRGLYYPNNNRGGVAAMVQSSLHQHLTSSPLFESRLIPMIFELAQL